MTGQPTLPVATPPETRGLIAGLIQGNQWLISTLITLGYFWREVPLRGCQLIDAGLAITLPKFNSLPLKIAHLKRKLVLKTIHFSGASNEFQAKIAHLFPLANKVQHRIYWGTYFTTLLPGWSFTPPFFVQVCNCLFAVQTLGTEG